MKHCIYYDWHLDLRAGGPTGYLANLRYGLDRTARQSDIEIWIERNRKPAAISPAAPYVHTAAELDSHIHWHSNIDAIAMDESRMDKLLRGGATSIHTHTCVETLKVAHALQRTNRRIPLIFTSHCPESYGKEFADVWRARGYPKEKTDKLEQAVRLIEAMAFRKSDIWIFPSAEAMEPYFATIPQFAMWRKEKDLRFVPTGACPLKTELTRAQAKKKFGVEGKKVVLFIGRHTGVKGYDLLCQAGEALFQERTDTAVLVAGRIEDGVSPPNNPNWIELGWCSNPGDLAAAADVFVLPNRMTYYDLILIEMLSTGVPIVASATGGNKSVAAITDGAVELYLGETAALLKKLRAVLSNENGIASRLSNSARAAYDKLFTPVKFAENYIGLIEQIYDDYHLASGGPQSAMHRSVAAFDGGKKHGNGRGQWQPDAC
jgi:glycosyltransferase involved in cell wall biosynthesis